jgi:hypothetical protein
LDWVGPNAIDGANSPGYVNDGHSLSKVVAVSIPARLSRALHKVLGDEGGDDLVNWMVQVGQNRSELRDLMDAWIGRTDSRFAEAAARMDERFAQSTARMNERFAESAASMNERFAESATNMNARFAESAASVNERFANVDRQFVEHRELMLERFSDLKDAIAALEIRIQSRFADLYKWSFIFWCGAIGFAVIARILIR